MNIYIYINIYIYKNVCVYLYIYIYIYISTDICFVLPRTHQLVRVNEYRTTDATRVLKAPGAELCQNAYGVVNEQKIFCSHQCSPECSMNKFRAYISTDTCFILPRTHQCGSGYRVENN